MARSIVGSRVIKSNRRVHAVFALLRPKQWLKNVLVFAAPGAGGVLGDRGHFASAVSAFVIFCIASSGTYCINDTFDVHADQQHTVKRLRPVAAGVVSPILAVPLGLLLWVLAVGWAFAIRLQLGVTMVAYVLINVAYSAFLKRVDVVDIMIVASGFLLRSLAGGAATGVRISDWFFVVASFGSLLLVSGKRGADSGETTGVSRRTGSPTYSETYVSYLRSVSSAAVLVAYCLWAFDRAGEQALSVPYFQLSIFPFVLGVLRYALLLDRGQGGTPEDIALRDRPLQLAGLAWLAMFVAGVYGAQ